MQVYMVMFVSFINVFRQVHKVSYQGVLITKTKNLKLKSSKLKFFKETYCQKKYVIFPMSE